MHFNQVLRKRESVSLFQFSSRQTCSVFNCEMHQIEQLFTSRVTRFEAEEGMRNCVVAVKRARGRVRFAPLFCSDSDDEAEAARNDGRKNGA